jgi:tRNA(Ile)-lysidine synthase
VNVALSCRGHHAKVPFTVQREVASFLRVVRHTIAHYEMVAPGDHVLVALSGGADSVATLAALVRLAPRLAITVSAAHVHHRLRGAESDRDAAMAGSVAAQLNVSFQLHRLSSALKRGGNTEERARCARYDALDHAAREVGATKIATGHTRDDQAETVLLRIVRGSGPRGLAGVQPVRDGRIIRPLLDCTRVQVEAFVAAETLRFCEDSSNHDFRFLRNRIRHEVLPLLRDLNPRIDRALADLATLSHMHEKGPAPVVTSDAVWLSVTALRELPTGLRRDLVRDWLRTQRGSARGLALHHVTAVLDLLRAGRPNRGVNLPGGTVLREYDRVRFVTAGTAAVVPLPCFLSPGERVAFRDWQIAAGPVERYTGDPLPRDLWSAVVDVDMIAGTFNVRNPVPGDRVRPCGMTGRKKLSDIFIDRRVPRALRASCPVVESGAEVVWVPGVVRGACGLVGRQTRRVVWLRVEGGGQPLLG